MPRFADIIEQAQRTVESVHGGFVRYAFASPVGVAEIWIPAVPTGLAGGVAVTDDALMVESKSRDFLIRACDLQLGSGEITPQKGDTITELDDHNLATGYVYTVTQPAQSDAPWRWHDHTHLVFRVHTKETAVPA
ncbi:MAG TPA: hypothetical protein VHQ47_17895 [Phycisphaerae bacterium]|jgi:hypothetical protein|nr:hypothetical protein [Phycisphaerae bacterium]